MVDWERVAASLAGVEDNSINMRAVREMIETAHDEWWEHDRDHLTIDDVEQVKLLDGDPPFKYVTDVTGRVKSLTKWLEKRGVKVGDRFILDWKTSAYNFSTSYGRDRFTKYYQGSTQNTYYLGAEPADFFWYRGISKEPMGGTHEFLVFPQRAARHGEESLILRDDLHSAYSLVRSMDEARPHGPWLKNAPDACDKWNMRCPHYAACQGPRASDPSIGQRFGMPPHLSFSAIQALLSCPDRYRRDRLVNIDSVEEGSEASKMGSAFHLGMASLYTQLKELQ